jgi:hypothetical protein
MPAQDTFEKHFDLKYPSTLSEFINAVEDATSLLDGFPCTVDDDSWVWRGQTQMWPIHSAMVRHVQQLHLPFGKRLSLPQSSPKPAVLDQYDRKLFRKARRAGHHLVDGRTLTAPELMARLQHHGAATRLLDFTASLLVALWFACWGDEEETGLVFGAHVFVELPDATDPKLRDLEAWHRYLKGHPEGEDEHQRTALLIRPPEVTKRVASQKSVFLASDYVDNHWGSIDVPRHHSVVIGVTSELKEHMSRRWKKLFGFSESTIFPDIDGFGMEHHAMKPFSLFK